MIYIITTKIGKNTEAKNFYTKMDAVSHYRLKVKEMVFPDTINIEMLNDGEDNNGKS